MNYCLIQLFIGTSRLLLITINNKYLFLMIKGSNCAGKCAFYRSTFKYLNRDIWIWENVYHFQNRYLARSVLAKYWYLTKNRDVEVAPAVQLCTSKILVRWNPKFYSESVKILKHQILKFVYPAVPGTVWHLCKLSKV